MKPAALYARVSTDKQKEEGTIESQIAALLDFAEAQKYTIAGQLHFIDNGYSGSNLVRPGLERLRDFAHEGQLETILVLSPDRLSRRYVHQVLLTEELERQGVEVRFLKGIQASTPEERLLAQFQGMFAEYERTQIVERARRGKKYRAKQGAVSVLSHAPYGFRYVRDADGTATYQIEESEARVVREIFRLYTQQRLSAYQIGKKLQESGVYTRTGRLRWKDTTILCILRNPAYKGTACYNKTKTVERKKVTRPVRLKGGYSPRPISRQPRPKDEWIEIPVPMILDEHTFEQAQEQMVANSRFSSRKTKVPTLLQGLLVCGECSYAYCRNGTGARQKRRHYYRCLGTDNYRFENGRVCHSKPIDQDYLDALIWDEVIGLLKNPDLIRQELQRRLTEQRHQRPVQQQKRVLNQELAKIRKASNNLVNALQEELVSLEDLRARMPPLKQKETALVKELRALEIAEIDQATYLQVAHSLAYFQEQLSLASQRLDVLDKQRVLRLLVKDVIIYKDTIKIVHSIPARSPNHDEAPQSEPKKNLGIESSLLQTSRHDAKGDTQRRDFNRL